MALGEIIRTRREELGLTQDSLSLQAGISKPYLSNIETGRAKNPPSDNILRALERALELPRNRLMRVAHLARTPVDVRQEHEMLSAEVHKLRGVLRELLAEQPHRVGGTDIEALASQIREDERPREAAGVAVPVINRVAAGYPRQFTDLDYPPSVADEYIRVPDLHDPQAFAARVVGDSMLPRYREGDIVVFSPAKPPAAGDDCFVRFDDGGTTFKRFYQDDPQRIRLQPLNAEYPAEAHVCERVTGLWPAVYRVERLGRHG